MAALDPVLTPALRQEGLAREMVNRIQRLREGRRVRHLHPGGARRSTAPRNCWPPRRHTRTFIQGETLARRLVVGSRADHPDREQQVTLDGLEMTIGIQRHDDARPSGRHTDTDEA